MMRIVRLIAAAGFAALCLAAAPAAPTKGGKPAKPPAPKPGEQAQMLVAELYKAHMPAVQGRGQPVHVNRQVRARFFTPELIALIERAEEDEKRTGTATWNADPITDSQDPEVRDLKLAVDQANDAAATVVARFEQHGARTTVSYRLVRTKLGWRVDDILGGRASDPRWSLRALFAPPK